MGKLRVLMVVVAVAFIASAVSGVGAGAVSRAASSPSVDPSAFVGIYRLHTAGKGGQSETSAILMTGGGLHSARFGDGTWSHHGKHATLTWSVSGQSIVFRGVLTSDGLCSKAAPCNASLGGSFAGRWWAVKKR